MNLKNEAKSVRREILDLAMAYKNRHIAPAFSTIETLVVLFNRIMRKNDKFILSKGHGCLGLYVMLKKKGLNPKISGHPDIDLKQGIECTTGSLGHGLPIATGMALAKKLKDREGDIYVLMSDGECQEGATWESALIAAHHKLNNLTAIVDYNKIQSLGRVEDILSLGDLKVKFQAFGFYAIEVNGHSIRELSAAFNKKVLGKPKIIIANTIKGKGVSFMEDKPEWHNRLPNEEELRIAKEELR
jgi:transketolase